MLQVLEEMWYFSVLVFLLENAKNPEQSMKDLDSGSENYI